MYLRFYGIGHMVKIAREETHCHHLSYSFRLTRVLLYAQSHRQDSTYHNLCCTSCGAQAGMRNSSMGPPWGINLMTHCTIRRHYHGATSCSSFSQWESVLNYNTDPNLNPNLSLADTSIYCTALYSFFFLTLFNFITITLHLPFSDTQ